MDVTGESSIARDLAEEDNIRELSDRKRITYYEEDGMAYWTMGAPIDETTIVNRCRKEQTYEYHLTHGTLPEPKGASAEQGSAPDSGEVEWHTVSAGRR